MRPEGASAAEANVSEMGVRERLARARQATGEPLSSERLNGAVGGDLEVSLPTTNWTDWVWNDFVNWQSRCHTWLLRCGRCWL